MLRFTSSPTHDMLIGDLRIALFNHIVAEQRGENLIVRIQDMDKDKNIEDKDKEILNILGLFGIAYTQTTYQSESVRFHTAMALQLMHERKAFSCFCSDGWIANKQEEAKVANKPYSYDDACANLPAELVIDNTNPFSIRIRKPENNLSDSFIILNQDKRPTDDFACAIDDMLSDISIVIRSEKYTQSTFKEEHIRTSLEYDKKIQYIHLGDIETDADVSVKGLLEEGFLPQAIANYLLLVGNTFEKEVFILSEVKEFLDIEKISLSSSTFNMNTLRHINREHLKALDDKELSRYVGFADEEIGCLAKIYLEDVSTTKELKAKIAPIFASKKIPKEYEEEAKILKKAIKSLPYFETYEDFKKQTMKNSKMQEEKFLKVLRLILTGEDTGPELAQIYKYMKNYIGEIVK